MKRIIFVLLIVLISFPAYSQIFIGVNGGTSQYTNWSSKQFLEDDIPFVRAELGYNFGNILISLRGHLLRKYSYRIIPWLSYNDRVLELAIQSDRSGFGFGGGYAINWLRSPIFLLDKWEKHQGLFLLFNWDIQLIGPLSASPEIEYRRIWLNIPDTACGKMTRMDRLLFSLGFRLSF